MAAINEAWHVLGDPARRAQYDATLTGSSAPRPSPPPPAPPRPAPPRHARFDEDDDDLGEPPVSEALVRRWALVIGFLFLLLVGFGVLTIWLGFGN
jgi:hypothetical protein